MFEEYKLMSTLTYVKLLLTTLLRISSITYEIQNQNGVQPVNKMHIPPKNFHWIENLNLIIMLYIIPRPPTNYYNHAHSMEEEEIEEVMVDDEVVTIA